MKNFYTYDDTIVTINYDFWTNGGIMKFTVLNKSVKPIYFDWNASNFNYKGKEYSYISKDKITQKDSLSGTDAYFSCNIDNIAKGYFVTASDSSDSIINQSILLPNASITVGKFRINEPFLKCGDYPSEIDTTYFSEDNSILHFSNCLAYSFTPDFKKLSYIDNDFWINNLITINGAYYVHPETATGSFYISSKRKSATLLYLIIASTVVFGSIFTFF